MLWKLCICGAGKLNCVWFTGKMNSLRMTRSVWGRVVSRALAKKNSCPAAFTSCGPVVPVRFASRGGGGGGHHINKMNTMSDLPIPEGCWYAYNRKMNQKRNLQLILGVGFFIFTLWTIKMMKVVDIGSMPIPPDNDDLCRPMPPSKCK